MHMYSSCLDLHKIFQFSRIPLASHITKPRVTVGGETTQGHGYGEVWLLGSVSLPQQTFELPNALSKMDKELLVAGIKDEDWGWRKNTPLLLQWCDECTFWMRNKTIWPMDFYGMCLKYNGNSEEIACLVLITFVYSWEDKPPKAMKICKD